VAILIICGGEARTGSLCNSSLSSIKTVYLE
jgi:hypothetical protein